MLSNNIETKIYGNRIFTRKKVQDKKHRNCNNYKKKSYGGHQCLLHNVCIEPGDEACQDFKPVPMQYLKALC